MLLVDVFVVGIMAKISYLQPPEPNQIPDIVRPV